MEIISRARWGAVHDPGLGPAQLPAAEVWLHHSVTIAPDLVWVDADGDGVEDDEERAMRLLEQIGEQRFGGGISYTFAVMPSGRIYDGHGVDRKGAHTGGRNSIARAIVLVGDYSKRPPTEAQLLSVAWLLRHGHSVGWWRAARLNGGHRQAPGASTECPGRWAMEAIPTINQLAAAAPPAEPTPEEDEDMSVAYVKGDSTQRIPGTVRSVWGDVVFLCEWDVQEGVTRAHVASPADPGYRLWVALGRPIRQVGQAVLDAVVTVTPAEAAAVLRDAA